MNFKTKIIIESVKILIIDLKNRKKREADCDIEMPIEFVSDNLYKEDDEDRTKKIYEEADEYFNKNYASQIAENTEISPDEMIVWDMWVRDEEQLIKN